MEVTPDIYAWLVNLNILDGNKSLKMKKDGLILLQEALIEKMFDGLYIEKILFSLEEQYNKFYKIKLNYTDKLKEMKKNNSGTVVNSIRFHNWKIIADVLSNFGIEFDEEKISKICTGNKTALSNLLKTVYTLCFELVKRSFHGGETTGSGSPERLSLGNPNRTSQTSQRTNESNNLIDINNIQSLKQKNQSNLPLNADSVEISSIDPNKDYSKCISPLEFFVVSLCRNLVLKPRQAIALLSNNRKYLIQVCNKGIKGDFEKILLWFQDLALNARLLTNLLKISKDGKSIGFATLCVGMYSKNYHIAMNSYNLVSQLQADMSADYEWFMKEGVDAMLFSISKHPELRVNIINLMYEFSRKYNPHSSINVNIAKSNSTLKPISLEDLLMTKLADTPEKEKLFDFFSSIIPCMAKANLIIFQDLKKLIFETLLKEGNDKASAISLLTDAWIYFRRSKIKEHPFDTHQCASIVNFLKKGIREGNKKHTQIISVIHLFRLMLVLGEEKDEYAPTIYKTLVFLFLESYDNAFLREQFLISFGQTLVKNDTSIPINILLDPYLRQLKSSLNFDLSDFKFIAFILEHPRIGADNIKDILEFIFQVSLTNLSYSRSSNLILNLILEKGFIPQMANDALLNITLYQVCSGYIRSSINLFIQSVKAENRVNRKSTDSDIALIESAYDLVNMNIDEINSQVVDCVIDANKFYRGEKNHYSMGLLAMLWMYEEHDDVLLNLEEKYAERYEPQYPNNIRDDISETKNMSNQHPEHVLQNIKKKKIREEIKKREEELKNQLRERRIKKNMEKKLEQKSLELGMSKANSSNINNTTIENRSLIQPEGSIIHLNMNVADNSYKNENPYKNFILPILLEDEENREIRAIEGLTKQYSKELHFYFKSYLTEVNETVTKANVLRLFRDIGIDSELLTLEELTVAVRNIFGTPLNTLTQEQFYNLLIQLSYLVLGKIKINLPISQCYQKFLEQLIIPKSNFYGDWRKE